MTWTRLVRAELRKLTTTKMPWAFLAALVVISALTATAVVIGTDFDGSKTFISTAADQRSLMAFAANAMMGGGLFGAIAVAREYGHGTVIPTFLSSPRRHRAVLAQFAAVFIVGGLLSLIGGALTVAAVALSLPTTEFGFLVPVAGVAQVLAASALTGGCGAILGAGIGAIVRNAGGAVTGTVGALIIAPPLMVQMANDAASWIPTTLATVLSGVEPEVGTNVGIAAAVFGIVLWAAVPAAVGLILVRRRDVV